MTSTISSFGRERQGFIEEKDRFFTSSMNSIYHGEEVYPAPELFPGLGWSFGHRTKSVTKINTETRKQSLADDLSAWNGISWSEAYALIDEQETKNNSIKAMAKLFNRTPTPRPGTKYAFVDIETTGLQPNKDDIIEVSILVTDHAGNTLETFDELFNVSNVEFFEHFGVSSEDLTGISLDMISLYSAFVDSKHIGTIKRILNDSNTIMVSHNKDFENKWFCYHLPGFWEAHSRNNGRNKDELCLEIDTQTLTFMLTNTEKCRLEDLVNHTGAEYVDAHRAMNDVVMMKDAYFKLVNEHLVN